jgi:hypothetical protein
LNTTWNRWRRYNWRWHEADGVARVRLRGVERIRTLGYEPVWKDWDAALTM